MDELFTRGIDEIITTEEVQKALKSSHKLRIKMGFDPTSPDLHLGHAVGLRQLRQLQDMGHTIIFLIGDYTALIGDPSGRNKMRPALSPDEVEVNARTYLHQVSKILDVDKAEIRRNSEWLAGLSFEELLKLAANFTVAQLIEREDFHSRLEAGVEVGLHELLYPVMQAYDSVILKADVEFGGSDQRFNLLAGRQLQKRLGQRPQQIWLAKLLVGTDGVQKMSKSLGNYVGLTDEPIDMYGKVMSIPDQLIAPYYELCTDIPLGTIEELVKTLAEGANPRDSKASLAREIVRMYHGEKVAETAETAWNKTFRDKQGPSQEQVIELKLGSKSVKLADFLVEHEVVGSKGEVRRLIEANGIRINDQSVEDADQTIHQGEMINIGKTRFFRVG